MFNLDKSMLNTNCQTLSALSKLPPYLTDMDGFLGSDLIEM